MLVVSVIIVVVVLVLVVNVIIAVVLALLGLLVHVRHLHVRHLPPQLVPQALTMEDGQIAMPLAIIMAVKAGVCLAIIQIVLLSLMPKANNAMFLVRPLAVSLLILLLSFYLKPRPYPGRANTPSMVVPLITKSAV